MNGKLSAGNALFPTLSDEMHIFSLPGDEYPSISETPESLEELLTGPGTRELFHELVARYALRSGISGVQPKVLLDARERGSFTSARCNVKSWGTDYPFLLQERGSGGRERYWSSLP